MGPGCPVCVTDVPEVDEGVALARQGVRDRDLRRHAARARHVAARSPTRSAEGAKVDVVYSVAQAVELAREHDRGGRLLRHRLRDHRGRDGRGHRSRRPPPNFSVLSAHKYIPPVMEIVAEMPGTRVEGFLAAGHAATITGWGVFEPFVARHRLPVVVAGFEPLDILAGLVRLVELIRERRRRGREHVPALRHARGQPRRAAGSCGRCSVPTGGRWRGIAHVPNGNLRLRDEFAHVDARRRFTIDLARCGTTRPPALARQCLCGDIMAGIASPARLHALRQRVRRPRRRSARAWCQQRGHLPHLAPVRRRSRSLGERRAMDRDASASATTWPTIAITLKHGAGGRAMRAADRARSFAGGVRDEPARDGVIGLAAMDDGAAIRVGDQWLVLTTDSHVDPAAVFFPGGDIGRLAVSRHGQRPRDDGRDRAARASPAAWSSRKALRARDLDAILDVDARGLPRGRRHASSPATPR